MAKMSISKDAIRKYRFHEQQGRTWAAWRASPRFLSVPTQSQLHGGGSGGSAIGGGNGGGGGSRFALEKCVSSSSAYGPSLLHERAYHCTTYSMHAYTPQHIHAYAYMHAHAQQRGGTAGTSSFRGDALILAKFGRVARVGDLRLATRDHSRNLRPATRDPVVRPGPCPGHSTRVARPHPTAGLSRLTPIPSLASSRALSHEPRRILGILDPVSGRAGRQARSLSDLAEFLADGRAGVLAMRGFRGPAPVRCGLKRIGHAALHSWVRKWNMCVWSEIWMMNPLKTSICVRREIDLFPVGKQII